MWALLSSIIKTAFTVSLVVLCLLVVSDQQLTNQVVAFVVVGKLPNSNYAVTYEEILLAGSILIGLPILYSMIKHHLFYKGALKSAALVRSLSTKAKPLTAQLIGHTAVALLTNTSADWLNPLEQQESQAA